MDSRLLKWNEEKVAILTEGWNRGENSASIAKLLGPDFTRNMVIGKANRLKLPSRANTLTNQERKARRETARARREAAILKRMQREKLAAEKTQKRKKIEMSFVRPDSLNIPFKAVKSRQCRYIEGDEHLCCGHETRLGLSWCDYHFLVVYRNDRRSTPMADLN